jgi:hypothetical protein
VFVGEGVLFVLICGRAVPEWEDGEDFWTEVGQKIGLEERFRTGRCFRWQGKPEPAATRVPHGGITAIVSIEL